jgi:transcriptional regulator of NAD metabolism
VRNKWRKNPQRYGSTRETRGADLQYQEERYNPYLKAAILEVVENQLRDNDPPETRQTLERLLAAGYSRKQAVEMIGSAVVGEIWSVLHEKQPFDRTRFVESLEKLG